MQHPKDGKGPRRVWVNDQPVNKVVAACPDRGVAYIRTGDYRESRRSHPNVLPVVRLLTGTVRIEPIK